MNLNRRELIKSGLVVVAGLALPFSSKAKGLTDVDRILLRELSRSPGFGPGSPAPERILSRVEVDERLMERMNIRSIAGVRIEVLVNQPATGPHGSDLRQISYYNAYYHHRVDGKVDGLSTSSHRLGRIDEIDAWAKKKVGAQDWLPCKPSP